MLALEKWGRGRWEPLVMFAHSVALGAEAAYVLCNAARVPKFRDFLARVEDKSRWLENYRRQALLTIDPKLAKELLTLVCDEKATDATTTLLEELNDFLLATPQERNDLARRVAEEIRVAKLTWVDFLVAANAFDSAMSEMYKLHLASLRDEVKGGQGDDAAWVALIKGSTRIRFFFLVALPCWIEFGKSPTQLFDDARSGNFEALGMLLNVDHLCLNDPVILEQFQKHMQSNEVRRKNLLRAMEYKPLTKLKKKAVKVLLGALVYKVFNRVHEFSMEWQKKLWKHETNDVRARRHELTFPAVKRLFDAVYSDVHDAMIEDPDFSGITPDGFALSIKRELKFWPDF